MGVIESTIDRDSGVFRERTRHMESLVSDLTATLATIREGGGEKARERHRAKGKMPVRERINRLLDPGSPFSRSGPNGGLRCVRKRSAGGGRRCGHRPGAAASSA
jgi:Acetyl-CoA carboxylase, carboxyltransferase component (subunits alpha and beta)